MNKTNLMILAATMLFASVCAQFAAGADLCTGAVDPYDIVSEKGLFYASAGKDNELSAQEFLATRIGPSTFRRSFDKWSEMLKFDRDGNKSLDWMEAGAYRYAMRKMVLAGYDANKDGKLGGPERQSACKALASGKIRFPVKQSAPPPPSAHRPKDHKQPTHKPSSGKPDKNHDARSREASEAASKEARLREAKESHRQEALKRAAAAREASKKKLEEHRRSKDIEKYDKNKDGRLDDEESAALNESRAEQKRHREEFYKKYDSNGDGKISIEEKNVYLQKLKKQKEDKERDKGKKDKGKKDPSKRKPPKSSRKHSKKDR